MLGPEVEAWLQLLIASGVIVQRTLPLARSDALGALFWLAHVGYVVTHGSRQVVLVLLLLHQDCANVFGDGIFTEGLALAHPLAVVADGIVLVLQVEPQHLFSFVRDF